VKLDLIDQFQTDKRTNLIREVVYEFLGRKNCGEPVDTDSCKAKYPDLLPELSEALDRGVKHLRNVIEVERALGSLPTDAFPTSDLVANEDAHRWRLIRNHRLIQEIGTGGQGTVFRAIQESTERVVAIKVVLGLSRNSVARFDREVKSLAALNHPGIVGIIDRGRTADDAYYLVMDYVSGEDLDKWVHSRQGSPSAQREIVRKFIEIALAIQAAHDEGIIHRDLKPSNIKVDVHGRARILDFGLAHLVQETPEHKMRNVTVTGSIVGSILWASPEQAAGATAKLGPATDIYSLGVLLYQSLTDHFPYSVDPPLHEVTRNICDVVPKNPDKFPNAPFGNVSRQLTEILLKCLAKDPIDRFESGSALAAALQDYLDGNYVLHRKRRNRWLVSAQLLILGGIIFIGLSAYSHQSASQHVTVISLPSVTNSIGMKLLQIPSGTFTMGSPLTERGHQDNEKSHSVRISRPFFIGCTEVTCDQYVHVVGSLPESKPAGLGNMPVVGVSWDEANEFCHKLSEMDGHIYRLPTEAEWEYACRANTSTPYSSSERVADFAWYDQNSNKHLHPVASKAPNRFGLFDMHGNAGEWVLDEYEADLGSSAVIDPIRTNNGFLHSTRGGSAFSPIEACRSASRSALPSEATHTVIGFRVVIASPDK
jgi:eukaryotic-like serine/threonine-protein kinase